MLYMPAYAQLHGHIHKHWRSQSANTLFQNAITLPNNNYIGYNSRVLQIPDLLAPITVTWQSCVSLYSSPRSLCLPCLSIVLRRLERAPQFWLQLPHWVTKSTRRVSIFNSLCVYCHSLHPVSHSRVGSAGCGTTRFGSRRNLLSWREISTAPLHSTVVRPPSRSFFLPPLNYTHSNSEMHVLHIQILYNWTKEIKNGNIVERSEVKRCFSVLNMKIKWYSGRWNRCQYP